jgi:peptide/nickel transport system ATP-binding protein
MSLLEINDLSIHFKTEAGEVKAVNGITLHVDQGRTLGLVGETGAGKTTTALGILRLIPEPGEITGGSITYKGENLLELPEKRMREIRGGEITMIFQDPMTALNPVMTVGDQVVEVICQHSKCSKQEAEQRMVEILEKVGIDGSRAGDFPHQFSGGMKQRVVIAIALACTPQLLIADEPTTALDVTIQAQVLRMINDLKKELGTAMLLITHDLGIVAESCDDVAIMYAGTILEYGSAEDIFDRTAHPYTKGLFGSLPRLDVDVEFLSPIPGLMPDPVNLPEGCPFHPRCKHATKECALSAPPVQEVNPGHLVRCHHVAQKTSTGPAPEAVFGDFDLPPQARPIDDEEVSR